MILHDSAIEIVTQKLTLSKGDQCFFIFRHWEIKSHTYGSDLTCSALPLVKPKNTFLVMEFQVPVALLMSLT